MSENIQLFVYSTDSLKKLPAWQKNIVHVVVTNGDVLRARAWVCVLGPSGLTAPTGELWAVSKKFLTGKLFAAIRSLEVSRLFAYFDVRNPMFTQVSFASVEKSRRAMEMLGQKAPAEALAFAVEPTAASKRKSTPKLEMYMFTQKAIARELPADSLFIVTETSPDGSIEAWKCVVTPDGVKHPAYKSLLPIEEGTLRTYGTLSEIAGSQSRPTAYFKKDSLYKKVTVAQLLALSQRTMCESLSMSQVLKLKPLTWCTVQFSPSDEPRLLLLLVKPSRITVGLHKGAVSIPSFDPHAKTVYADAMLDERSTVSNVRGVVPIPD